MKTYQATVVTRQYQQVTVTVPDDYDVEQVEAAMYENASISAGEFENELYDLEEIE